jgi:hypothetical protein
MLIGLADILIWLKFAPQIKPIKPMAQGVKMP